MPIKDKKLKNMNVQSPRTHLSMGANKIRGGWTYAVHYVLRIQALEHSPSPNAPIDKNTHLECMCSRSNVHMDKHSKRM